MLALLVWKGMTAMGRLGQKAWVMVRGRPSLPKEPPAGERGEQALKET